MTNHISLISGIKHIIFHRFCLRATFPRSLAIKSFNLNPRSLGGTRCAPFRLLLYPYQPGTLLGTSRFRNRRLVEAGLVDGVAGSTELGPSSAAESLPECDSVSVGHDVVQNGIDCAAKRVAMRLQLTPMDRYSWDKEFSYSKNIRQNINNNDDSRAALVVSLVGRK